MKTFTLYTLLLFMSCFLTTTAQNTYNELDKEGLRKILRQEGQATDGSGIGYTTTNFELCGLTESDTLSWYSDESWIAKVIEANENSNVHELNTSWDDNSPKSLLSLGWYKGVDNTKFDLSNFPQLISLDIYLVKQPLSANTAIVDISNCPMLKNIYGNKLEVKDSNGLDKVIETISLMDSEGSLSFTQTPNLKTLSLASAFGGNGVNNIDLSRCPNIESVSIISAGISNIDVTGASKLNSFVYSTKDIPNNEITHIDFSDCVALQKLSLLGELEKLTSLDLSNNLALNEVSLYFLSALKEDIVWGEVNPKSLRIEKCNVVSKSLDLSKMTNLETLNCPYNKLKQLTLSNADVLDIVSVNNNELLFSQLPSGSYSQFNYLYQLIADTIYVPCNVDYSQEEIINGQTTQFAWEFWDRANNIVEVFYPTNTNGIFEMAKSLADKPVSCTMKNPHFPGLSIVTNFVVYEEMLVGMDTIGTNDEDLKIQQSIVSSDSPFTIMSTANGKAYLYNLNGILVLESNIQEGQNELYVNSNGLYLLKVNLNNGASKTFKVISK